jgi:3-hydroxybutyryl-CoA dehydrogenase
MYKSIAILGSGTMGYGFAIDFGRHISDVRLVDVSDALLQKGLANIDISLQVLLDEALITKDEAARVKANIHTFTDMAKAVDGVDIVIEALPEILPIKHEVMGKADAAAPEKTIFITNSSSLRPSDICSILSPKRRTRALMAHYFNPPEIMPLVELLALPETDKKIMDDIRAFYVSIGKKPVSIKREVAGLSANRIQMAVWRELLWQLENDIIDKKDLDIVLAYGPALRWATTGVITMLDMTGLDIIFSICNNLMKELDNASEATPLIKKLMAEKNLGLKTGKGFFEYPEAKRAGVKDAYVRRLAKQLALSKVNIPKD